MDIAKLTKDCSREDCRIVDCGSSTTLMGWSQSYDKSGKPTGRNPNTRTTTYRCSACGVLWSVKSRDGEADRVERREPQPKNETHTVTS